MTRLLHVSDSSRLRLFVLIGSGSLVLAILAAEVVYLKNSVPPWTYTKDVLTLGIALFGAWRSRQPSGAAIEFLSTDDQLDGSCFYAFRLRTYGASPPDVQLTQYDLRNVKVLSLQTNRASSNTEVLAVLDPDPQQRNGLLDGDFRLILALVSPDTLTNPAAHKCSGLIRFDFDLQFRGSIRSKSAQLPFSCTLTTGRRH